MKLITAIVVILLLNLFHVSSAEEPKKLSEIMKKKLEHAKGVLAGVTKQDFEMTRKHAEQLYAITKLPGWQKFKTEDYQLYSSEFGRLAAKIADSAKKKNIDEAALNYLALTRTCVICHKHLRDEKKN